MAHAIITEWYGRLGNNIVQIANALYVAKLTGGKVTFPIKNLNDIPKDEQVIFDILKTKEIICGDNIDHKISGNFMGKMLRHSDIPVIQKNHHSRFGLLPGLLKVFFREHTNIQPSSYDGVVIHVRSEDIYTHSAYVQAPMSYVEKALLENFSHYKNVLLITQPDFYNPVKALTIELCKRHNMRCDVHVGSTLEAASFFLGSKDVIVTGTTSFSRMFLLGNTALQNVVLPIIGVDKYDTAFLKHGCNVIRYKVRDYPTVWGPEKRYDQVTHKIENIIRMDDIAAKGEI